MTEDIALNEDFDVFVNARGDLGSVSGRDAFEQEVIIRITDRYYDIIGDVDRDLIPDMVAIEAERVAAEMERLDSIAAFESGFSEEQVNTLQVRIIYDTGDDAMFEVN